MTPVAVGYNEPVSSGWGADLLLLLRAAGEPTGVRLTAGVAECTLEGPGDACSLVGRSIRLVRVQEGGHWGRKAVAFLQIEGKGEPQPFFLWAGGSKVLSENGAAVRLEEFRAVPVVMLRSRHAPGNPWALVAAVLLGLGLLAMGRRWGVSTGRARPDCRSCMLKSAPPPTSAVPLVSATARPCRAWGSGLFKTCRKIDAMRPQNQATAGKRRTNAKVRCGSIDRVFGRP